jgi:very-short-patch-repair endonuclease
VTINEVVPREGLSLTDGSVGIVTPYRNQAAAFTQTLPSTKTLAATVDKFQGREKDIIIISTVDNRISDFASNPNRLNVAVSRAKKQLILVTNDNNNSEHSGIDELLEYINYHNFEIVESAVRSIFDNLYRSYYAARRVKRISEYASENLAYDLIEQTLHQNFPNLSCVPQYPLGQLCDLSSLQGRKLQYAKHAWTKVDFVIYQKTSKRPMLVVEVDGHAYHAHNDKQRERDGLKNDILAQAGLALIRLKTTESNEKVRLLEALERAISGS